MDLTYETTPALEELRAEVRTFLEQEYPDEYRGFQWDFEEDPDRWAFMYEYWRKLGARGWIWPTWPEEWGGRAMSVDQARVVREEIDRARAGDYGGIGMSVGPSIARHGTPEQKTYFLPRMAAGEIMWAEGYTEPNSGSDLASLRTRAERDGDSFVINGQKTFCTAGHWCNWMIIFARTDPDPAARHRGISAFLAPMEDEPAIQLTPLYNIADGRQNVVYFDNLRVPAENMLGDENEAWNQIWFGLGGDPIPTFTVDDPGPRTEYEPPLSGDAWVLDQLVQYCRETHRGGRPMIEDPVVRDRLTELATGVEVNKVLGWEGWNCRFGSHLHQAISKEFQPEFGQICMEILGPLGIIQRGRWAPLAGEIDRIYRRSFGNHAGGTSQVKRMVVATRALGLPPMSIDLTFEDHQVRLGDAARDVFARRNSPETLRAIEAGDAGFSTDLWQEVAALGWLGIDIPARHGGGGGRFLDVYPLFEELGRALVPGPYVDTVGVATGLLLEVGDPAQQEALLPGIAAGTVVASVALVEASGGFGPTDVALTATAEGDGFRLDGTKLLVGWVPQASHLIVAARTGGHGADGITLFLVESGSPGVGSARLDNHAAEALYEVTFDSVAVASEAVLGPVGGGWGPLERALLRGGVLQAAGIVGAGWSVLAMTNQYAKDREQFGIPIGKNQAVQYMVSDILVDVHRADLLNRQAAFRLDAGRPHRREAALSVAFAKQASAHFHRQAHEVHAGVAFIHEHDLTLYSKHAKHTETHLGDARWYRELHAEAFL